MGQDSCSALAVAMEYIEPGIPITGSSLLPAHQDCWMAELTSWIPFMKRILPTVTIMLIDFDWGGKEGEASYPTWNLNDELLKGRVFINLTIGKEDNRQVLKNTLARLMSIHRCHVLYIVVVW